ncbi:hypothetical protein [Embleya hyalina]|uniref:Uncharacterized protein n=1 Tax=Embleya hyalina TaxID=516124 RepID=A0A401YQT9_9ACTN|nr:hypothetical protein [Embleya hyalina]GCD96966.1 hypothetical protein EHYA_04653 [Embleya hyalina]
MEVGDGRMRLRVTSHPVADPESGLGRILSTGHMLRDTVVHPPDLRVAYLKANRADLLRLGALFRVAATSPHSAIHVPVPPGARPMATSAGRDIRPLPLLVAREDTGLRTRDWPKLRHRMRRTSTPSRVTAPAPRPADRDDDVLRRADRHPARLAECAATMVITARAEVLFMMGDWLTAVGDRVAGDRHIHRTGESFLGDMVGFFHPDGADRPMHAFCVVAVDPFFHRARRLRPPGGGPSSGERSPTPRRPTRGRTTANPAHR